MMASVASMIDLFNMENIQVLKKLNYQVEIACNFSYGSITSQNRVHEFKEELIKKKFIIHELPVPRSLFAFRKIVKSYLLMKKICLEKNYDIIHCHSPIGGMIARLACKKTRKTGTKLIYTAHGFHFYKGAPLINWILYYTAERILSKYTDMLITINKEDYKIAKRMHFSNLTYLPGIGIDVNKIKMAKVDKLKVRSEFNFNEKDFLLLMVGQLSKRKNHETVIRALSNVNNKNVKILICGLGELENYLKNIIKDLKLENRVVLAGYRKDIIDQLHSADCFVFPSIHEGLPVSLIESMASGLPIICSNIRGNIDLIEHGVNGFLVEYNDVDSFAKYIDEISKDSFNVKTIREKNLELVLNYDKKIIIEKMTEIYFNISKK